MIENGKPLSAVDHRSGEGEGVRPMLPLFLLAGAISLLSCGSGPAKPANPPEMASASIPPVTATNTAATKTEPCGEEMSQSVLNKLHPVLSLAYGERPNVEVIHRKQFRAKCIREWVEGSVTDPCVRQNYLEWLDYYDGDYRKKLEEISAPAPAESDSERYARERREQADRLRTWESSHSVPRPPEACERSVVRAAK